jgi:hypothetical protein
MTTKETAAERIKRLEEQIAKKRAALVREKGRLSEKERKTRTRKLIEMGGLAEIAGLLESDPGFILGALLNLAEVSSDSERWKSLKTKGDGLLKEREAARKKSRKKEG